MALAATAVLRGADLFRPAADPERRCTSCGHPAWLECDCLCCPHADGEESADFT